MNKEKLQGYWAKTKETLGNISKKMWILIGVIAAVVLAVIIGAVIYFNTRPYTALIAGASDEEVSAVRTWLQDQGFTDYKLDGTNTIMVPSDQAMNLKTKLLQEQYVNSSSSWQGYFDRVGALSTMKDREVAQDVALQEYFSEIIRGFDNVRDAEVVINFGEDTGYVLDTNKVVNASATVSLTMKDGKLLTADQANAIRYLISKGVAGLSVDEVNIHDKKGNIYDNMVTGGSGGSAVDSTALALQTEQWWNNQIKTQIEQMLAKAYGEENVSVAVHSTVELGDKTVNDYEVHLPKFAEDGSTNGMGIIGSRYYSYQFQVDDDYVVGGVVGTPTNSDLPTYVEEGENVGDVMNRLLGEGSIEADNSKTQTTMVISCATLKDVTISVMINSEPASGPIDIDVEQMTHHVATAAGIQAPLELPDGVTMEDYLVRKVSVMTTPFNLNQEPEPVPEPTFLDTLDTMGIPAWAFFAAVGGLVLFVIILVTVILLVRRGKRKKQEAEQRAVEELIATAMPGETTVIIGEDGQPVTVMIGSDGKPVEVQLDENGNPVTGADVMDLHTERSMELRQSIREFVDENLEVTALLLKSWMKEGGDNG